eukprot:CAMPEP_0172488898 /NCGR_PEP_ID=MMETSP1066-20121228/18615_1 /TAXON_ID=671091 /ORGANISM="Coscinodiscus wailesii, Strain CCMP2513" /LENGTH=194 /DNA_ID=CAMNT_0013256399 /DNA_START=83 /DNA_END=668 /DNA_ORIENTATION=+
MTLSADEYADANDSDLMVLIKASKWDAVRTLLQTPSGQAMTFQPDVFGNLPLHFCLGYRGPDDIVLTVLSMNEGATRVHGTDYWLPLHVAAMWGSSSAVTEKLIRCFPGALDDTAQPGIKGRTPRHFAGRFEHNRKLLEDRLRSGPTLLKVKKNVRQLKMNETTLEGSSESTNEGKDEYVRDERLFIFEEKHIR